MNLTLNQQYLTLTIAVLFSWQVIAQNEKKGPGAIKRCGEQFLFAYKWACLNKPRVKRSTVDISEITKDKDLPVLKEKVAKQFLRRIRLPRRTFIDNAKEECCVETCTLEEVSEYPCQ